MGIKGLFPFLRKNAPESVGEIGLDQLRGTKVAIDSYNWIHSNYASAKKTVINDTDVVNKDPDEDRIFKQFLSNLFDFIKTWVRYHITPVFVFDGTPTLEKNKERLRRREQSKMDYENMMKIRDEVRSGDPLDVTPAKIESLRKRMINTKTIKLEDFEYVKNLIISLGLPYAQAKYEGEQLCAMLAREGKVSAVYSTDGDNIAYGAPLLITNFKDLRENKNLTSEFRWVIYCECVWYENVLKQLQYSPEEFTDLCILSGCDYNSNMKGIAINNAHKHLQIYKSIENFPSSFDTKCLIYERCREMFSPVLSEEIIDEINLSLNRDRISLLSSTLEDLELFDMHYYLVDLMFNLEQAKEQVVIEPPDVPFKLSCGEHLVLNVLPS
jgi:flap endonuclease-1